MTTPSTLIEALKERTDALRKHVIARGGPAKDEDGKSVGSIWPKILEAADLVDRMATETTEPDAAQSRRIAFDILSKHGNCLRDDEPLNELIEDIATAIRSLGDRG